MEQWWNDVRQEKRRQKLKKTCSSATSSTKNLTLSRPGLTPGLSGDNPTPNSLVNGTGATQQTGNVENVQNINFLWSNNISQRLLRNENTSGQKYIFNT
jgi:hypothetical protein